MIRSISEISSCFFGPRPWHIEIRHRVKKTSTINLFGFETQIENLKIEIMETDRIQHVSCDDETHKQNKDGNHKQMLDDVTAGSHKCPGSVQDALENTVQYITMQCNTM